MQPHDHGGDPPDRDAFAKMLIDAIGHDSQRGRVHYDPQTFTLKGEGGNLNEASLGNVYAEYCRSSPEARAKIFRNFVRSWFSPIKGIPDDFEDAAHDLLPSVRARAYVEVNQLRFRAQGAKGPDWPYATVGEHLALALVYDLPESILSIQQQHLDDWDVSFADALERAGANLLAMSGHVFDQPAPGVWRSPWRDNHDTARLILLPLILAHEVKGAPVAMVPNRDTFLLTGDEDAEGLAAFAALAEEAFAHPRATSGHTLRLVENAWEPWLPPPGHPAHLPLRRLALGSLAGDYSSQKKALEAWLESQQEDAYVADCACGEGQDGEVFTFSVWPEGVDVLLPEAERIFFFRPGEGEKGEVLGVAPFERVREVVGDLLVEQDHYPARYRAREFPPEEMLAELFG
jgi:hypothetical protein